MIDTLKIYNKLINAGIHKTEAEIITTVLSENTRQLSKEFVSNKLMTAVGAVIFALGGFFANQMWSMSVKLDELEYKIEKTLTSIEEKLSN